LKDLLKNAQKGLKIDYELKYERSAVTAKETPKMA
jgi:hypothetical protein